MSELDTLLQDLRQQTLAAGHAFAQTVADRLTATREATFRFRETLPTLPGPEGLTEFRSRLSESILPAYQILAETTLSPDELSGAFRRWMTEQDSMGASLPEKLTGPEPERLYEASSADSAVTALRKGSVRLTRRFAADGSARTREMPLRTLGLALSRDWLPIQFGKVLDDDRRRLSRHASRVEKAVSDLVFAALEAENRWLQYNLQSAAADATDAKKMPATSDRGSESVEGALQQLEEAHARLLDRLDETPAVLTSVAADHVDQRVEQAWVSLDLEVAKAGSFMSAIPDIDDALFAKRLERIDARSTAWKGWKGRLAARASYLLTLVTLRIGLDELIGATHQEISATLIRPVKQRTLAISRDLDEAELSLREQMGNTDEDLFDQRSDSLKVLGENAATRVQESLVEPIKELSLLTRIQDENQDFLQGLSRLVDTVPDTIHLHPLATDPDTQIQPDQDPRIVELADVVRNGFADINADLLALRTSEARDDLKESLDELVSLPAIVRFSFESATAGGEGSGTESEAKNRLESDQRLIMMQESLQRTRDAVGTIADKIETAAALLMHAYRVQALRAWTRIQERLQVEHQVGAYVMDVRSRLDAEAREAGQRLSHLSRQVRLLSERLLRRGHREAKALIERGKEAVGTPTPTRASFHDTALGLAELEEVLDSVPAVYRRLFSFQPLSDPDLLIGRSQSVTFLRNQLHHFDLGMPQAALLVGGPSSGRTSLLNVLKATDLSARTVRTLRLEDRPSDSGALLRLLAESLQLPVPQTDHIPNAASALVEALDPSDAPVCIVEHLEVLILRGIGGYDLLVDMLQLMSLTDSRIIWMGTMSSFAWQLLKTADADSAALVSVHAMTDLTRDDLERLIMERHRKSGIPLEFAEPEEPSPLLKRKLRRVSSRDMRQHILRDAFFDRLFSQFGQNIQMALLQWIRSVRMANDAGSMTVVPTPALNLSFFAGFNLDQVFALKAILEHGALSPNEYARVDRIPEERALTIFETLGNALVIETVAAQETGTLYRHTAVEGGRAYRIRPLFSHAVVRLLRERNVVH